MSLTPETVVTIHVLYQNYKACENLLLRESVAYPVLITAETPPPPPPPRISTGGRAQMGGFKGLSLIHI